VQLYVDRWPLPCCRRPRAMTSGLDSIPWATAKVDLLGLLPKMALPVISVLGDRGRWIAFLPSFGPEPPRGT
jgi:hypothetical protein